MDNKEEIDLMELYLNERLEPIPVEEEIEMEYNMQELKKELNKEIEMVYIIKELKNNYNGDAVIPITATEGDALGKWTLADLFIRQYLNNGGDGFGMTQVEKMYHMLCINKDLIIKYDLVSKDGINNSGYTLWKNYGFDGHPFLTSIQHDDN